MKPPYHITSEILELVSSISRKTGEVNARFLVNQNPKLRKQNQIKTIHSSLQIEGNTLTEEQITAMIENKRVAGPEKDIKEVLNAIEVYKTIKAWRHFSEIDFLKAHKLLMKGLVENPGKYRSKNVGITKGSKLDHQAPPPENVRLLMLDLFKYVKNKSELPLIKSCVFHYELEFIHPFIDGNGRMGRLWQTLILMDAHPVFEFLPFESLVAKNQLRYYKSLSASDKEGKSTRFIEFMLSMIDQSMDELLQSRGKKLNETERLEIFLESNDREFTRKDYLKHFSEISSATASRDLRLAVQKHLIKKYGDKKITTYKKI